MIRLRTLALAVVATACSAATTAYAQGGLTGQISGTVIDHTNAVLPGVVVVAKNITTEATSEAVTDGTGAFVMTNLLA